MTWWEWALVVIWGPGTLLALVVALALGVHLIQDRRLPAPLHALTGDQDLPQPRTSTDVAEAPVN